MFSSLFQHLYHVLSVPDLCETCKEERHTSQLQHWTRIWREGLLIMVENIWRGLGTLKDQRLERRLWKDGAMERND